MSKERYNLPSGLTTTSVNKYIKEWRSIANDVIAALPDLNLHLIGYDPGFLFGTQRERFYGSVDMTTSMALAIQKLYRSKK